jgi:hypothetical protein
MTRYLGAYSAYVERCSLPWSLVYERNNVRLKFVGWSYLSGELVSIRPASLEARAPVSRCLGLHGSGRFTRPDRSAVLPVLLATQG